MSSNYQQQPSTDASRDYREIVGFWKTKWFVAFFAMAAFFFVGGFAIASFGTDATGFAAGPDPYYAMGGVMGSLGLVTVVLWVSAILFSIWFRYKREFQPRIEF